MLYAWGDERGKCSSLTSNNICRNVPIYVWGEDCKSELKKENYISERHSSISQRKGGDRIRKSMYSISFTTRKHHRCIQNTSTISDTNQPTLLLRFSTKVEETSVQDQILTCLCCCRTDYNRS